MISSLLIANRGEIACRIIRTCRKLGVRVVTVYSDADAGAPHVKLADQAVRIGPAPAAQSYLNAAAILEAARASGAQAVHPGYGFLSENADFAEACEKAGLIFVGPPASAIRAMGLKDAAKALMIQSGVPVVPGYHGQDQSADVLAREAAKIGFPVLIKAVAGGGGKGMRRVDRGQDFAKALEGAQREAKSAFGDERVLVEKYVATPRHIEIQVFADAHGNVVHLFERDCSLQRRHQKVIEEAPAPGMPASMRAKMGEAATRCAKAIGYRGAGTVEFIADGSRGLADDAFYFMEMNTRLQVEHPVTEMITGQDLVEWQLRVASGETLPCRQEQLQIQGHSIEARVYAEDPIKGFLPSIGTLHRLHLDTTDENVRVDSGIAERGAVSMFYDPMIAKVIAWGATRNEAAARLANALRRSEVAGVKTNLAFLSRALTHTAFLEAAIDTGFIERHKPELIPGTSEASYDAIIFAALHVLLARAERSDRTPWSQLDGWRLGDIRQVETLEFQDGVRMRSVCVLYGDAGWVFLTDGEEASVITANRHDGVISAQFATRTVHARVLQHADEIYVMSHGQTFMVKQRDMLAPVDHADEGSADLRAPMPGKVIQILTKPGERVKKGQALAIVEAMKMEHTLAAPADLIVKDVLFKVGDQVGESAVIVRFDGEKS